MTQRILGMNFDEWLDISVWFTNKVNYVLIRFNLKVRMIDQSNISSNTVKAIKVI